MLIRLMRGVRQFQNGSFKQMQDVFQQLSMGQKPEILFITCSDSRLMPNLLTQTKPGELFIIRNVGNIIPPSHIPSSEAAGIVFALNELDSIKDIIICGHSHCGAMKGLLTPNLKEHLPEVASWLTHSQSVLEQINNSSTLDESDLSLKVHNATKLNILLQMEHLKSYPIIAEKMARNELAIHGWLYEFEKGEVLIYQPQDKEFISLENAFVKAVSDRRDHIIEQVAMNHLNSLTHPQTAREYRVLMQLFSLLEKDILPIWQAIKHEATQKIWTELEDLYPSLDDDQFTKMLEKGCELKLNNLKDFQKNIMESDGYHQYMGQIMRHSLFQPPPKAMAETLYESLKYGH